MDKFDHVFIVRGEIGGEVASNYAFITDEFLANASPETFRECMSDSVRETIEERYGKGASFVLSWSDVTEHFKLHCQSALS